MQALHRFAAAVALSLMSSGVYAQTFDVSETTAVVSTTGHNASVTFTQGATATTSFDFALNYDPTLVQFTGTGTVPTGVSCADPVPLGTVLCFADAGGSSIPLNALPNPSVINLLFTIGATTGTATLTLVPGSITDVNGGSQTASGSSDLVGTITITAAPVTQGPTLTFTPAAPGPIALSAGGTGSIAVAAGAGTSGTTTALVCTASAGFTSTVTGSPFAPNSSGTVNLGCTPTPGGPVQNGTVSCDPTPSAGTDQAASVFNVTCPAAPAVQAPTLTFSPAAPGPLTISGTGAGTIGVTASTGTTGTSTTLACTSTNGSATVTGSPFGAAGGTGSVAVQCNPAVGAAGTAFTVTCDPTQSAGTDQAPQVFNATCPAITPQPEFDAVLSVSLLGAPGTTATGSTTIRNLGNAPLTLTCAPATGGFTVTGPPASIAAGGTGTLGVSCTTSGASGTSVSGGLVCTTNDTTGGEGTVTFAFSCTSQLLSVPALGNTAKGMLVALLAGLGLFGFAMRRRIV